VLGEQVKSRNKSPNWKCSNGVDVWRRWGGEEDGKVDRGLSPNVGERSRVIAGDAQAATAHNDEKGMGADRNHPRR